MRTLVLFLSDEGTAVLQETGQRIVVVKSCHRRTPLVVWTVVAPSPVICLSWTEEYGLFAAALPARSPARLAVRAALYPAQDRMTYRYRRGAFSVKRPRRRIPQRNCGVVNGADEAVAFGLLQRAEANGCEAIRPTGFVVLAPGAPADLAPDDEVIVWPDMAAVPGMVLLGIPAHALVVPWHGEHRQDCCFDVERNAFVWSGGRK